MFTSFYVILSLDLESIKLTNYMLDELEHRRVSSSPEEECGIVYYKFQ